MTVGLSFFRVAHRAVLGLGPDYEVVLALGPELRNYNRVFISCPALVLLLFTSEVPVEINKGAVYM